MPKARVDDVVGDDRHVAVDERDPHRRPDERRVARVVGVDGDGGVAEDRLGAGGRDRDRRVRVRLARRLVDQVVADAPQRAGLGRRDHLEVADAGPAARAPVDQRLGPIREALLGTAAGTRSRTACAETSSIVNRRRPQSQRAADASLLVEDHVAGRVDERPHPLEVALAAEASRGSRPPRRGCRRARTGRRCWRGRGPGRNSVGRPSIRAWRIIRSSTVVRWAWPRWRLPGDVGRRLDDHERRQGGVRRRARAVRREHVRREPPLVDRVLELRRDRRPSPGRRAWVRRFPGSAVIGRLPETKTPRSSSGRTGSWYHLLVRGRCPPLIAAGRVPASSRRAIGRQPHGSRATFASVVPARLAPSRARSVAVPDLLFSVVAVRPGV